jgi:hypothetical protein
MHISPEHFGPWLLQAEATPTMTRVMRAVLEMCTFAPSVGLSLHRGLRPSAKMTHMKMRQNLCWRGCSPNRRGLCSGPWSAGLGAAWARGRNLSLPLK